MWWYFFAEVFPSWRVPLKALFSVAIVVPPLLLTKKLHKQPLLLFVCQCIVNSMLKPYPTATDAAQFMVRLDLNTLHLTIEISWENTACAAFCKIHVCATAIACISVLECYYIFWGVLLLKCLVHSWRERTDAEEDCYAGSASTVP